MLSRRLLIPALTLFAVPASYAYIRSMVSYSDGTRVPLKRTDNAAIQFYINSKIGPSFQSSATNSTVFPAASDPVSAIRFAASSWNNLPGAKLKFLPLKSTDKVADPNDGQMTVIVGASSADLSAVGGALAVTTTSIALATAGDDSTKGVISDSDIIINPAYGFSTDGTGQYDLQAVMTHEFGHSLGMNHSGLVGAVMFQAAGLNARILTSDEIGFATSIYPGASPNLGTITGKAMASDGSAVQNALVEFLDTTTGNSMSALTDSTGTYSFQGLPGNYVVYVEPLAPGSVVQPVNLYLSSDAKVTNNFQTTMLGGFSSPMRVAVTGGATTNVPAITVTSGASSLSYPTVVGIGRAGSTGDFSLTSGAMPVPSGQSLDLELIGGNIDASVSIQAFGKGLTVRPGTVRLDPTSLSGILAGKPFVRFTVDAAAVTSPTLVTLVLTKGSSVFAISGAFVLVPSKPTFVTGGVVSAATAQYIGAVSPGGISTIYDVPGAPNLGPDSFVVNAPDYDEYGKLPATLAGLTVTFDGVPAPLFLSWGQQINLQVPFEVAGKTSTKVVVNYQGSQSAAVTVPVVAAQPAFYMISATDPYAANSNYSLNSASNPGARGTVISVFGTGVGKPSYDIFTGTPAPAPPSGFSGGYSCALGGKSMSVPFAGWTPTAVGLSQWSFIIPTDAPTGAVSLKCTDSVSGASTQTATIYIK